MRPAAIEGVLAISKEKDPNQAPTVGMPQRPVEVAAREQSPAPIPRSIGGYRVKQVIDSGGMGTVYLAIQEQPRRTVALKVMKKGIASKSALRRFEFESQILARLKHPCIAEVYAAGTHDDGTGGVPYFAMEYIANARTITEFASAKSLGTRERLELFTKVCEGIHHGHQKGIIHRDLKPGNILVDASGQPKIIDFGVARSTDSDMAVTTLQTDIGQLIGTLQYMSPEQCDADPHALDTRSDVYALGIVLYELLCGCLPYDVGGAAVYDAARMVREQVPAKPSTLDRTLRGDVETIALKALEKEKDRRYQSASELASDIRRYLRNEPIVARPPSVPYQFAKFAKRNKAAVVGAAAVFMALVAGTVVSIGFGLSEAEQRRIASDNLALADQRADELETVTTFQQSMLSEIDAELMGRSIVEDLRDRAEERLGERGIDEDGASAALAGFDESVRGVNATNLALKLFDERILGRAVETIEQEFAGQPSVRASLQQTVADTYRDIGLYEPARPLQEAALRTRRDELGEDHLDTLGSINNMGALLQSQGKLTEAEPYYRESLEGRRRVLGNEHPRTLTSINNMGVLLQAQGKLSEAEHYLRESLEGRRRVLGDDHPMTLNSINSMGHLLQSQGKPGDAELYLREAEEGRRRVLGDDHPDTLASINNMGALLRAQGKLAEAEPYYNEALDSRRRVLGDDHPMTLRSLGNLGILYKYQGRYDEAEPLYLEALEIRKRVLGKEHPETLFSMMNLALFYHGQDRFDEALPIEAEAVRLSRRVWPDGAWFTGAFLGDYGSTLLKLERYEEAEVALLAAHETLTSTLGLDHSRAIGSIELLAQFYDEWGMPEKAAEWRAKLPSSG